MSVFRSEAEIIRLNELLKTERMNKEKLVQEKEKIENERHSVEIKLTV